MLCFRHEDAQAIGTCRACNKGLCRQCAVDHAHSISCKGQCEEKARTLDLQVRQSAVVLRTQGRNRYILPTFFMFSGLVLAIFAHRGDTWFGPGSLLGIGFVVLGVVLAVLGSRYKRELDGDG